MRKYNISVGCIFKNEAINLKEWLNHYLNRGVDHFYLIDDNSDDNYIEILNPLIKNKTVTLFNNDVPKIKERQIISYNKFLLPEIHNSNWFIVCDLDEFLYSPNYYKFIDCFEKYNDYNLLISNWLFFDSNGNISHPNSIVDSCIKRIKHDQQVYAPTPTGWCNQYLHSSKYVINSKITKVSSLDVHNCVISPNKSKEVSYMSMGEDCDLITNHYATQSRYYWENVKMKRGDVNNWHSDEARNWDYFNAFEVGTVIDTRLKDQNKNNTFQNFI